MLVIEVPGTLRFYDKRQEPSTYFAYLNQPAESPLPLSHFHFLPLFLSFYPTWHALQARQAKVLPAKCQADSKLPNIFSPTLNLYFFSFQPQIGKKPRIATVIFYYLNATIIMLYN